MKFHCFSTQFTSISYSSETTKGRGKSVHFLKALFKTNSEVNVLDHILSMGLLIIFRSKDYYFMTHATKRVLTENECFLSS